MVGLLFLVLVVVGIVGMAYLLQSIGLVKMFVGMESVVKLTVNTEDRGSFLVSMWQAQRTGMSYAEVLGDVRASNHIDHVLPEKTLLGTTLNTVGKSVTVYNETGGAIYGKETKAPDSDIALPGGRVGKVAVK
jgi:hypothetical protein